jgi:hypothetical protein
MQVVIKKTTSAGVIIKIEWSASMLEISLDGDVCGSDLASYGSIELTDANGDQLVWSRDVIHSLKSSLPDMPRGARGAISGSKGTKEVMQLIGQETYNLIVEAVSEAKEKAESDCLVVKKTNATEDLVVNTEYSHLSLSELKAAELNYDNANNEGMGGYNPYRDSLTVKKLTLTRLETFIQDVRLSLDDSDSDYELSVGLGNGDIYPPDWVSISESDDHLKVWDNEDTSTSANGGFIWVGYKDND